MKVLKIITLIFILLSLSCAATIPKDTLMKLELDMTKSQVIDLIGEPDEIGFAMKTKSGRYIEAWRYGSWNPIYFGFRDGKLVLWGKGSAFRKQVDRLEIKLK